MRSTAYTAKSSLSPFITLASVSFIIPAHNEERLLGRTLTAIDQAARALREPVEVIVVDDASTDGTAAIAHAHRARVISVKRRQIAAARNAGAREASGEMLVFVDADTIVSEAAVRAAIAAMHGGAVGGGCAFRFDGRLPAYGRVLAAVAVPLYRAIGLASGCFLFCTRDAFRAAGGFDETLFGAEEAAMSRALRRQGRFVILREFVTTSGRKLRAHSGREVFAILLRLALTGPKAVRQRDSLGIWYGTRREDPDRDATGRISGPPPTQAERPTVIRQATRHIRPPEEGMEPRLSLVTLGVSDLQRAIRFYEDVLRLPRLESPPSIAFFELGKTWLALYPRDLLAADAGVSSAGSGFPGFTLAHNLGSVAEVDRLLAQVASAGGRIVKPAQKAEWGGYSGYFADPDGFLWEVAWNPQFPHL